MENDAISRSEALEVGNVRQVTEYDEAGYYMTYNAVPVNVIEALPAIDAVPVVRCKDCRSSRMLSIKEMITFEPYCLVCRNPHGAGVSYPEYDMTEKVVLPDNYCSYGKRRTNGR